MRKIRYVSNGFGLTLCLVGLLLIAKLLGLNISWLWVLSPLWIYLLVIVGAYTILIFMLIKAARKSAKEDWETIFKRRK